VAEAESYRRHALVMVKKLEKRSARRRPQYA
jgi:hypothetical protein